MPVKAKERCLHPDDCKAVLKSGGLLHLFGAAQGQILNRVFTVRALQEANSKPLFRNEAADGPIADLEKDKTHVQA